MLRKVISGGQTGADIAALRAAKIVGLETGGWMPSGFRTLSGPMPHYASEYGVVAHSLSAYPPRTEANVRDSDATLRFASDFQSAGEKCTWNYIVKHRKRHFDVELIREESVSRSGLVTVFERPSSVAQWIVDRRIEVLNVAGNSEFTQPGIEVFVYEFLIRVFNEVHAMERK